MPSFTGVNNQMSLNGDNASAILDQLTLSPNMTIETYKEQVTSSVVLKRTVAALGDKIEYGFESLRNKISVFSNKDSGNISIAVTDSDPELATFIVNTLREEFMKYVSEIQQKQLDKSIEFLNDQIMIEKGNLEIALYQYENYLTENEAVEDINMELEIKRNSKKLLYNQKEVLINNYESKLLDYELYLKTIKAKIELTTELMSNESEIIDLNKDIYSDTSVYEYFVKMGIDIDDVHLSVQESNPLYYQMKSSLYDLNVAEVTTIQNIENLKDSYEKEMEFLVESLDILTQEIDTLNVEYYNNSNAENILLTQINHSKSTYESLLNKIESVRIAEASNISENNIIVISEAYVPKRPISPNKTMNVAIGAVLGMMVSIFYVFFRYYMTNA